MKLYKTKDGIVIQRGDLFFQVEKYDWDSFINDDDLYFKIGETIKNLKPAAKEKDLLNPQKISAPIQNQEIWASGVTYIRSKEGRQEESEKSGGSDFYARVYEADRPELFFKSNGYRAIGPGGMVSIRKDSSWNVPEPELTLVITSSGRIVGYTIGNDMSSRSIEGENPLYLPQAKVYDGSTSIGPCIYVSKEPISSDTVIKMEIHRLKELIFTDKVRISQIKRKFSDLVAYLYRELTFPSGCFLMTGTGIVPPHDFTLQKNDEIRISVDQIGTLVNTVN